MTLGEAIVEVYESTDEQSDVDIGSKTAVDVSKSGSIKIMAYLKQAQDAISTWRRQDGRRLRFRSLVDEDLLRYSVVENIIINSGGTFPSYSARIVAAPGGGTIVASSLAGLSMFFADLSLVYPVVNNTSSVATLAKEVSAAEGALIVGEEPVFSGQKWIPTLPNSKRLIQVVGVFDIDDEVQLERTSERDRFSSGMLKAGRPTKYIPIKGGVLFDICPEESIYYRVMYQRYPTMPTTIGQSFELPDQFHDPICEYAKYAMNMRIGKSENAMLALNRCNSIIMSLRLENDIEEDMIQRSFEVTDTGM